MIPVYTKERRHISIAEIKRIMGFPDSFEFNASRTDAIKQLANAVCPPVINSIGRDVQGFLSAIGYLQTGVEAATA
jgi:DNA (cytosine-5)-methyltransferase 1